MDSLEIIFAPETVRGYNEPALGLYASAVVNGRELPEILDLDVFFKALSENGVLPLFTCTCGVFGCGGYYVGVTRTRDAWVWRDTYAPEDTPDPAQVVDKQVFEFAWPHVHALAADLVARLRAVEREMPGTRLVVAGGGIDMREHLEQYTAAVQTIARDAGTPSHR